MRPHISQTQEGYLLIADITGYTRYLTKAELEHAQGILTALLELLIDHTRPPLVLSHLAGDAVISYGLPGNFYEAQTFVEMIEATYVAFRQTIERLVLNNTCRCNACANIGSLDLKFFVHYGTFGIRQVAGLHELVGSDVELINRLLKNQVVPTTGVRAYTLYTEAAIGHLGLEAARLGMRSHNETYEELGQVRLWVRDMHPVWEKKHDAARLTIPPERLLMQFSTEIAMPPELVWDYLASPAFRNTLIGSDRQTIENRQGGRIGPGRVFQCWHGDTLVPETILEWQPFERLLTQDLLPVPVANTFVLVDYRLEPIPTGTRLTQSFSKTTGPADGQLMPEQMLLGMGDQGHKEIEAFRRQIEADIAARRSQDLPTATPVAGAAVRAAAAASLSGSAQHRPGTGVA